MNNIMQLFLHPVGWIFCSCVFFWIIKKTEPAKTVLCLKLYCILMMPLAIEALIRIKNYLSFWDGVIYFV